MEFSNHTKSTFIRLIRLSLVWLLCLCTKLQAQELDRAVVANAGSYFQQNTFGNLHWTLGEIAVASFQNEEQLQQGFHQVYYDFLITSSEEAPIDWTVKIFPNPTSEILNIETKEAKPLSAYLYSVQGQLIYTEKEFLQETKISLQQLPAGVYWLKLIDKSGRLVSYQIQKSPL